MFLWVCLPLWERLGLLRLRHRSCLGLLAWDICQVQTTSALFFHQISRCVTAVLNLCWGNHLSPFRKCWFIDAYLVLADWNTSLSSIIFIDSLFWGLCIKHPHPVFKDWPQNQKAFFSQPGQRFSNLYAHPNCCLCTSHLTKI